MKMRSNSIVSVTLSSVYSNKLVLTTLQTISFRCIYYIYCLRTKLFIVDVKY